MKKLNKRTTVKKQKKILADRAKRKLWTAGLRAAGVDWAVKIVKENALISEALKIGSQEIAQLREENKILLEQLSTERTKNV